VNLPLFDARSIYSRDFEELWQRYKGPKNQKKPDCYRAYTQVALFRPPHDVILFCVDEYLSDIRKRKVAQQHLSTWLRGHVWTGYLEDALLRKKFADHPELIPKPRSSFRANMYPDPAPELRNTRTAAEVLAMHGKKL